MEGTAEQGGRVMVRILAPHFVAAIVRGGECAPILSYMRGWTLPRILAYVRSKRWTAEVMP